MSYPSHCVNWKLTGILGAVYKATKLTPNGDVKSNGAATVADAEDDNDDDVEAGPALPPDETEETIDDEEGRFFGGGITNNTANVLNFLDQQDMGDDAVWNHQLLQVGKESTLTHHPESRKD